MIGKLGLIMLVVKDMERSTQFYRDVLGLEVVFQSPGWTHLDAGNIHVGLHPEGKAKSAPTMGCTFGFYVADVRKTADELKAKGVPMILEPKEEDFGWLAIVADPDGYAVQLGEMGNW